MKLTVKNLGFFCAWLLLLAAAGGGPAFAATITGPVITSTGPAGRMTAVQFVPGNGWQVYQVTNAVSPDPVTGKITNGNFSVTFTGSGPYLANFLPASPYVPGVLGWVPADSGTYTFAQFLQGATNITSYGTNPITFSLAPSNNITLTTINGVTYISSTGGGSGGNGVTHGTYTLATTNVSTVTLDINPAVTLPNNISGASATAAVVTGSQSNIISVAVTNGSTPPLNGLLITNIQLNSYLGFVSGQARVPQVLNSGNTVFNCRKAFIASVPITNIEVALANWYGNNAAGSGAQATMSVSIEYPSNTFNQLFFGGNQYTNIPSGGTAFSDLKTQPLIPSGALFWIRTYYTNHAGIIYSICGGPGDASSFSTSGADDTTNGALLNFASPFISTVAAVLGNTTKPSVLIVGDSRDFGIGDVNGGGSAAGPQLSILNGIDRMIDPYYGSCNMSVPGDTFALYTSTRISFTNFATVIWTDLGINGLGSATYGSATNFYAQFGTKPVYVETLSPDTTSANGWMTLAGQTPTANDTYRTNFNELLRTHQMPYISGYLDVAALTESSRNSGLWQVLQSTNFPGLNFATMTNLTFDGLHGSYFGMLAASVGDPLRQQTPNTMSALGGWSGQTFQGNWVGAFTGNGEAVSNLNASQLTIGAVPLAALGNAVTNLQPVASLGTVQGIGGALQIGGPSDVISIGAGNNGQIINIGSESSALDAGSVVFGVGATTTGNTGVAVGFNATSAFDAISIGDTSSASVQDAIAIGADTSVSTAGNASIAIGTLITLTQPYFIQLGRNNLTPGYQTWIPGTLEVGAANGRATNPVVNISPVVGSDTNSLQVNGTNGMPVLTVSSNNVLTANGGGVTNINASAIIGLTNSINAANQYKDAVNEATAAGLPAYTYNNTAGTITGLSIGGLTVDGIVVQQGDSLLVKNEATSATNGVYICTSVGSLVDYVLTRRNDFNAATNIVAGDTVFCLQGAANTNTTWVYNTAGAVTVGTTPLNFAQINLGGAPILATLVTNNSATPINVTNAGSGVVSSLSSNSLTTAAVTNTGSAFTMSGSTAVLFANQANFQIRGAGGNVILQNAAGITVIQAAANAAFLPIGTILATNTLGNGIAYDSVDYRPTNLFRPWTGTKTNWVAWVNQGTPMWSATNSPSGGWIDSNAKLP